MITDSKTAIRALKDYLIQELSTSYPSISADIVLKDDEFTTAERRGRVCAVFEVQDDVHSAQHSSGLRPRREIIIKGACEATGFNGGLTGILNLTPDDVELMAALQTIIGDNHMMLGTSGLYMPSIRVGQRRQAGSEATEGDLRENEFRITAIYLPKG